MKITHELRFEADDQKLLGRAFGRLLGLEEMRVGGLFPNGMDDVEVGALKDRVAGQQAQNLADLQQAHFLMESMVARSRRQVVGDKDGTWVLAHQDARQASVLLIQAVVVASGQSQKHAAHNPA